MQQLIATLTAEARAFFKHSLRDWGGRLMLALGVYLMLFFIWQICGWGGPAYRVLISDLAGLPVSLAAGALVLRAAGRPGLTPAGRRGWRLVGYSLLCYFAGDLAWFYFEIIRQTAPFPSVADLFYLMQFPLLLWGILSMPSERADHTRFWLDALTVLISGWVATWYLVIGPTAAGSQAGQLAKMLSVAYPVADLLLFFGLVVVLFRRRDTSSVGPRVLLALGVVLLYVGDLAYGRQSLAGQYEGGDWPDSFWLAGIYVMLVAGQHRFFRVPRRQDASPMAALLQGWVMLAMPYVAVVFTFGLLIGGIQVDATTGGLLFGAVAVTLTVMVRQVLVLRENSRLLASRAQLLDDLRHMAFHDSLTNLANRAQLRTRVEEELASRETFARPVALLFIDLDGFKTVNDSLGHQAGDRLLQAVAARLLTCVGPDDTVARLGGDEFALLLPGADEQAAIRVAEGVAAAVAKPFSLAHRDVYVFGSTGIAIAHPGAGIEAEELLRNADVAMYTAKGMGQGQHAIFRDSMHQAAMARLEMEADLRVALEQKQFFLHYQPVVQLATGQIAGVEALVRWQHPGRGVVPPADFIPLTEETGLILPLGRFVLYEACAQAARWQQLYACAAPITLSVNLSARQLMLGPELVADVARALAETGLAPGSLSLEITESVLMHSGAATADTLNGLKDLGVRLAIDDFGTGYSSLSYLRGFPIDTVKIDRSFIDSVGRGRRETALLRGIVDLSRALGLVAVAEGIERPDQAAELEGLGCALGQGYWFSRPGTAEQIGRRLAESWEQDHAVAAKNDAVGLPL
ncbi:MAG: uncharacterized protein K0R39_811 [Symbiobacteriaceae bacterium]|jgi:diguanylate cyclase (GGDEF)-like protein|nr:uncharacterized protein [Symbiobacteriaceae bacterium]